MGSSLFKRTTRGVVLTDAGKRTLPHLEEIAQRLHAIQTEDSTVDDELTIAAPSYLASPLLRFVVRSLPNHQVRGLMLAPSLIRAFSSENLFDAAITMGTPTFPKSWVSTEVGLLREGLFASPSVAKSFGKTRIDPKKLESRLFVGAVDGVNGQLVPANDGCPLGPARKFGHHAVQLSLALEFAAESDQLVYGVALAARDLVERGELAEIRVRGWNRTQPLVLTVNADRVLASVQHSLARSLRAALSELGERADS